MTEDKSFDDVNNIGRPDGISLNNFNINPFCVKGRMKEPQIPEYNTSKDSFEENGGMDSNLIIVSIYFF